MAKIRRKGIAPDPTPPGPILARWSPSADPVPPIRKTHWRPFRPDEYPPLGKWVLVYMLGKVCPAQALMTPLGARHLGVFEDFEGKPKCVEMPIEAITHWRDLPEGPS